MSLLVLQLPPRERLAARGHAVGPTGGAVGGAVGVPAEWHYVLSADGRTPTLVGHASAAFLPKADQVVLLLAEADVSWHRVDIPKAPAARLSEALAGVMEEALLDEGQAPHFALAPDATPGHPGWVAVTDGPRLSAALQALESSGQSVERVVTAAQPAAQSAAQSAATARGHFHWGGELQGAAVSDEQQAWLTLARADGVITLRLGGGLARARWPADSSHPVRWSSTPAAAQAAERWLGAPVPLLSDAERALEATQSALNLRQFELAPRTRGTRALRQAAKRLFSDQWRPVRLGLIALVMLQLAGLNMVAWKQRQALVAKREAMTVLLKTAHPSVRTVLDAPLQMQRETDRLRAAAGQVGASDLESLLAAAAAAWPDGQGPTATLRFEPGSLSLAASGWAEPQVKQFRERIRAAGYAAEFSEGRVVLTRPKVTVAL
jgi:general secretion pathway protein L